MAKNTGLFDSDDSDIVVDQGYFGSSDVTTNDDIPVSPGYFGGNVTDAGSGETYTLVEENGLIYLRRDSDGTLVEPGVPAGGDGTSITLWMDEAHAENSLVYLSNGANQGFDIFRANKDIAAGGTSPTHDHADWDLFISALDYTDGTDNYEIIGLRTNAAHNGLEIVIRNDAGQHGQAAIRLQPLIGTGAVVTTLLDQHNNVISTDAGEEPITAEAVRAMGDTLVSDNRVADTYSSAADTTILTKAAVAEGVAAAVSTIVPGEDNIAPYDVAPTGAPEADGTLSWDSVNSRLRWDEPAANEIAAEAVGGVTRVSLYHDNSGINDVYSHMEVESRFGSDIEADGGRLQIEGYVKQWPSSFLVDGFQVQPDSVWLDGDVLWRYNGGSALTITVGNFTDQSGAANKMVLADWIEVSSFERGHRIFADGAAANPARPNLEFKASSAAPSITINDSSSQERTVVSFGIPTSGSVPASWDFAGPGGHITVTGDGDNIVGVEVTDGNLSSVTRGTILTTDIIRDDDFVVTDNEVVSVNINGTAVSFPSGGSDNAVEYVAQTLTDPQQAQARTNIDAQRKIDSFEAVHASQQQFDDGIAQIGLFRDNEGAVGSVGIQQLQVKGKGGIKINVLNDDEAQAAHGEFFQNIEIDGSGITGTLTDAQVANAALWQAEFRDEYAGAVVVTDLDVAHFMETPPIITSRQYVRLSSALAEDADPVAKPYDDAYGTNNNFLGNVAVGKSWAKVNLPVGEWLAGREYISGDIVLSTIAGGVVEAFVCSVGHDSSLATDPGNPEHVNFLTSGGALTEKPWRPLSASLSVGTVATIPNPVAYEGGTGDDLDIVASVLGVDEQSGTFGLRFGESGTSGIEITGANLPSLGSIWRFGVSHDASTPTYTLQAIVQEEGINLTTFYFDGTLPDPSPVQSGHHAFQVTIVADEVQTDTLMFNQEQFRVTQPSPGMTDINISTPALVFAGRTEFLESLLAPTGDTISVSGETLTYTPSGSSAVEIDFDELLHPVGSNIDQDVDAILMASDYSHGNTIYIESQDAFYYIAQSGGHFHLAEVATTDVVATETEAREADVEALTQHNHEQDARIAALEHQDFTTTISSFTADATLTSLFTSGTIVNKGNFNNNLYQAWTVTREGHELIGYLQLTDTERDTFRSEFSLVEGSSSNIYVPANPDAPHTVGIKAFAAADFNNLGSDTEVILAQISSMRFGGNFGDETQFEIRWELLNYSDAIDTGLGTVDSGEIYGAAGDKRYAFYANTLYTAPAWEFREATVSRTEVVTDSNGYKLPGDITLTGTIVTFDNVNTAGGGVSDDSWYWRTDDEAFTITVPTSWQDAVVSGRRLFVDAAAADVANLSAIASALGTNANSPGLLTISQSAGGKAIVRAYVDLENPTGDLSITLTEAIYSTGAPAATGSVSISQTSTVATSSTSSALSFGDNITVTTTGGLTSISADVHTIRDSTHAEYLQRGHLEFEASTGGFAGGVTITDEPSEDNTRVSIGIPDSGTVPENWDSLIALRAHQGWRGQFSASLDTDTGIYSAGSTEYIHGTGPAVRADLVSFVEVIDGALELGLEAAIQTTDLTAAGGIAVNDLVKLGLDNGVEVARAISTDVVGAITTVRFLEVQEQPDVAGTTLTFESPATIAKLTNIRTEASIGSGTGGGTSLTAEQTEILAELAAINTGTNNSKVVGIDGSGNFVATDGGIATVSASSIEAVASEIADDTFTIPQVTNLQESIDGVTPDIAVFNSASDYIPGQNFIFDAGLYLVLVPGGQYSDVATMVTAGAAELQSSFNQTVNNNTFTENVPGTFVDDSGNTQTLSNLQVSNTNLVISNVGDANQLTASLFTNTKARTAVTASSINLAADSQVDGVNIATDTDITTATTEANTNARLAYFSGLGPFVGGLRDAGTLTAATLLKTNLTVPGSTITFAYYFAADKTWRETDSATGTILGRFGG